jgi:hypothetical protein
MRDERSNRPVARSRRMVPGVEALGLRVAPTAILAPPVEPVAECVAELLPAPSPTLFYD